MVCNHCEPRPMNIRSTLLYSVDNCQALALGCCIVALMLVHSAREVGNRVLFSGAINLREDSFYRYV